MTNLVLVNVGDVRKINLITTESTNASLLRVINIWVKLPIRGRLLWIQMKLHQKWANTHKNASQILTCTGISEGSA